MISGFALGLVFWSILTPNFFYGSGRKAFWWSIFVTIICMAGAWHVERNMVHGESNDNNAFLRKTAVYAAFIRTGLIDGTVELDGMPKSGPTYRTAYGKTFIALSPLLVDSDKHLSSRVHGVLDKVVANNIRAKMQGPQGFYNHAFLPSAKKMNAIWQSYYHLASTTPEGVLQTAVNRWSARAIQIPGQVHPYLNALQVHNSSDFFQQPAVQNFWRYTVHLPLSSSFVIEPGNSYAFVRTTVWPTFLSHTAQTTVSHFEANDAEYLDGGTLAKVGENAVSLLTIPALAISLSIFFALLHLSKVYSGPSFLDKSLSYRQARRRR